MTCYAIVYTPRLGWDVVRYERRGIRDTLCEILGPRRMRPVASHAAGLALANELHERAVDDARDRRQDERMSVLWTGEEP